MPRQTNTHLAAFRTFWWAFGAVYVLAMLWLSLSPTVTTPQKIPHFDKVLHASAHFVLCGWFFPLLDRKLFKNVLIFSITLGALIECLQFFSPGRMPDAWDLVANVSGALLAALLMRGSIERLMRSVLGNKTPTQTHDVF